MSIPLPAMPHKAGVFANTYIACASGSDSGAGGNRENVVSTTEAGGIDVCAGVSGDRMWRGGCTGCASARHVELDVLQGGLTCMSACATKNASVVCGASFGGRGNASVGICNRHAGGNWMAHVID